MRVANLLQNIEVSRLGPQVDRIALQKIRGCWYSREVLVLIAVGLVHLHNRWVHLLHLVALQADVLMNINQRTLQKTLAHAPECSLPDCRVMIALCIWRKAGARVFMIDSLASLRKNT